MRFFKKDGHIKFRKTEEPKVVEEWMDKGWEEVNSDGSLISKPKSKPKSKKED